MDRLRVITGPMRNTVFELADNQGPRMLGRAAEADGICLSDRSVSRKHAEIFCLDGLWQIRDIDSSNGTFLNEQRLAGSAELKADDQIRCGSTVLLFETDRPVRAAAEPGAELDFDPGETMVAVACQSVQSKQSYQQQQRILQAGQAALNLSHGIKNLLQAVATSSELLDSALTRKNIAQAGKSWNILKRNLQRIHKLVLDMLKFSKESQLHLQPCQFNRLVESVVDAVRDQAVQRGITIATATDDRIGLLRLDPDRIYDVVLNLLLNAVEAVAPQTGLVNISTELDIEQNRLVIRIADNGAGINDLSSIFEPFHTTKTTSGVGLGLAIVRKTVLAHNGSIDAQSIPGEGTVFVVKLPYLPVEQ